MPRRVRVLVGTWLTVCVVLAHGRTLVWQDSITLWLDAVRVAPTAPRPIINLARSLDLLGFPDQALPLLTKASRIAAVPSTFSEERRRQWWAIALTNEARSLLVHENPHEAAYLSSIAVTLANRGDARHLYHVAMYMLGNCTRTPLDSGAPAEKGQATSVWRCPEPLPVPVPTA